MDVFTPAGDGPWPVVVSFHGLSNSGKDIRDTVVVAEEAATRGMVVFTPTWIAGDPFPITIETVETWDDTVSCAVSFAQQNAAEYGGDPTKTVVDGFSAGAGAALLFSSQDPRVDPITGCATDASPTAITGFVIGDVESWLHSQNFDGAFEADLEAMQVRLATLIDPTSWPPHPDAEFFLWVAAEGHEPENDRGPLRRLRLVRSARSRGIDPSRPREPRPIRRRSCHLRRRRPTPRPPPIQGRAQRVAGRIPRWPHHAEQGDRDRRLSAGSGRRVAGVLGTRSHSIAVIPTRRACPK